MKYSASQSPQDSRAPLAQGCSKEGIFRLFTFRPDSEQRHRYRRPLAPVPGTAAPTWPVTSSNYGPLRMSVPAAIVGAYKPSRGSVPALAYRRLSLLWQPSNHFLVGGSPVCSTGWAKALYIAGARVKRDGSAAAVKEEV